MIITVSIDLFARQLPLYVQNDMQHHCCYVIHKRIQLNEFK